MERQISTDQLLHEIIKLAARKQTGVVPAVLIRALGTNNRAQIQRALQRGLDRGTLSFGEEFKVCAVPEEHVAA